MKQREKYTKSGQTGSEGGILWEGDITNDETQTGEGRNAASFVTSLRAGGDLFQEKPGPTHCSSSIVSLSAASGPPPATLRAASRAKKKKNKTGSAVSAEALVLVVNGEEHQARTSNHRDAEATFQDTERIVSL